MRRLINKKAQTTGAGVTFFFVALAIVLAGGFIIAAGVSITGFIGDEVFPELEDLSVGNDGLETATSVGFGTANTVVQGLPVVSGIIYLLMLMGTLGIAFIFRVSGEKYLIILFFMLSFALILASIVMSQVYQDFYEGEDEISQGLQDQKLLSFLLLYSPVILTVIMFIGAGIMFTGGEELRVG